MKSKATLAAGLIILAGLLPFPAWAQGPGKGRGAGGHGGGQGFQEAIHKLFENHKEIRRTVEMTADGYKARTVSDNPEIAKTIQKHVKEMRERLGAGMMIRRWDPAFAELVEHYGDIEHEFKDVDGGVEVVVRGKNADAIKVVQNHARIVSGFAEKGPEQMHATHPRALEKAAAPDSKEKEKAAAGCCPKCAADPAEGKKDCPDCKKEQTGGHHGKEHAPAAKEAAASPKQ